MTPRRHIIDGLYRCLCPQLGNYLHSKFSISRFRFPLSTPSSRCLSSTPHGRRTTEPATEPSPIPKDEEKTPHTPNIHMVDIRGPSWNKPVKWDHRSNPGNPIHYPSRLQGIDKIKYLARHGTFPQVFDEATILVRDGGYKPDLALYEALICACASFPGCLLQGLAFNLLAEMKQRGIMPNSAIYHHLLKLLSSSPDYLKRAEVLEEMRNHWCNVTDDGWQWVIAGHLLEGHLELALEIIDERRKSGKEVHRSTYEHAIYRLCGCGEAEEALRLAQTLESDMFWKTPSKLVYDLLVVGTRQLHLECTTWAWMKVADEELFVPDDGLCLAALNVAARHGAPRLATDVFRVLLNREVDYEEHHFAAFIETYVVAGKLDAAFSMLHLMRAAGVDPNPNTARSILNKITANDDVNDVVAAYLILKGMCKRKKPIDVAAINAVIAGFVRLGDVKAAFGVYKDMPDFNARPNVSTFNTLLKGGADQGRKQFSMWVAAEMNEMGLKPDRDTYEHLFTVCVVQDDFTDAFTYLEEMKAMGFKPAARVYNALGRRCRETADGRFEAVLTEMEGCGYGIDELVMVELKDGEGYDESVRNMERKHHERIVL